MLILYKLNNNFMKIINDTSISEGDRLNAVIVRYFESQNELSSIIGVDKSSLSSYISGRRPITKKFANKLQKSVGISSDYILNGIGDMMIDNRRSPILIHSSNVDSKTFHSMTKQYILRDEGTKQKLVPIGEMNIVNLIFGDNKKFQSFTILQNSSEFARIYDIAVGSILVLEKEYSDEDLILYTEKNKKHYYMGIYDNGKIINKWLSKTHLAEEMEAEGHITLEIRSIVY